MFPRQQVSRSGMGYLLSPLGKSKLTAQEAEEVAACALQGCFQSPEA